MLFELINSISVATLANEFINYTVLTVAFFSFFALVNSLMEVNKAVKIKNKSISVFK